MDWVTKGLRYLYYLPFGYGKCGSGCLIIEGIEYEEFDNSFHIRVTNGLVYLVFIQLVSLT